VLCDVPSDSLAVGVPAVVKPRSAQAAKPIAQRCPLTEMQS